MCFLTLVIKYMKTHSRPTPLHPRCEVSPSGRAGAHVLMLGDLSPTESTAHWMLEKDKGFWWFLVELMGLSGYAECFPARARHDENFPHMPGYCTTGHAIAKSRRTYAQAQRSASRPLKLSQHVPKADLMPKFVYTNIARHSYRRCTFPLYLCQPVTFP